MTNLWNDQASFRFVLVVTEDSQHLATSGMPAVRFGIDYGGQFASELKTEKLRPGSFHALKFFTIPAQESIV